MGTFEDWALFTLRYELWLLLTAFKKDVDDPERVGIHENHFYYYYNRYFKKQLTPKHFGKDTLKDLCGGFLADSVSISASNLYTNSLAEDAPTDVSDFVKLQEENRRERQRRIDAGDESVRIDFSAIKKQIEAEKAKAAAAAAQAEKAKKQA